MGKRELFALLVFLVSCDCCVALPHDAMGLLIILTIFDAHVVWSWTALWSAEHRTFISIAITHIMLSLNVTCIHIHVMDVWMDGWTDRRTDG